MACAGCGDSRMRRRVAALDNATLTRILPDYEADSRPAIIIREELARRGISPDASAQGGGSATLASDGSSLRPKVAASSFRTGSEERSETPPEAAVPPPSTVNAEGAPQIAPSMLDMLNAALTGNMEKAERLLNDGLGVNDGIVLTDKSAGPAAYLETTALHMAATMSRIEVVQFLLANGADPLTRDGKGRTPLEVAENATIAAILKDSMAREKQTKRSHTERVTTSDSIHEAVGTGNMPVVRRLLLAGADVNASVGDGWRPLHVAADVGHLGIVKLLIEHGASLNTTRRGGFTPLFTAAQLGRLDIVKELVKAGAVIEHRTGDGGTALFVAAANGHVEVVEFLITSGANPDVRSKKKGAPLGLAAELGNLDMVRVLLAESPDINAANSDGFTALHLAAQNGHSEVIPLLIEHGASVTARTKAGKTPRDIAQIHGHSELVESLEIVTSDGDRKSTATAYSRGQETPSDAQRATAEPSPPKQLTNDELAEFAKSEAYANANVGRKDKFNDYLNAGMQFFRSGKLKDALSMFDRVLEQDDLDELGIERWTVLSNRALVYANLGQLRQAYEDISQSIELAETDPSAKGTTGLRQAHRMKADIKRDLDRGQR